jgi:hypothetical protein
VCPSTLVVQIQPDQQPQVRFASGGGPVHAAREEARIVHLEPVEAVHLFLQLISLAQQHPAPVPVQILADDQSILDVAPAAVANVYAVTSDRAPAELIPLFLQHEIASFRLHDPGAGQGAEQFRPPVEMNPSLRLLEGIQPYTHTLGRRLGGLQVQQQLPADAVRIVVRELLEVQHMLSQPARIHGCHDCAHAALRALAPRRHVGIGADKHFFGGVAHAGPQLLERLDVPDNPRDGERPGDRESRNARYGMRPSHVRWAPMCPV